jgi:hypothetical protein
MFVNMGHRELPDFQKKGAYPYLQKEGRFMLHIGKAKVVGGFLQPEKHILPK